MMKLLHIDSSILGDHSISRALSAAAVEQMKSHTPDLMVTYRDLVANPIPHLTGAYIVAAQDTKNLHNPELQNELALSALLLEEFLAADIIVMGVAQYNLSISSQLKAWIDRVAVAGKTFRYTEKGVEGLAVDKRVILTASRGGFYEQGSPSEKLEHSLNYLKSILMFMGILSPEIISADGVAVSVEQRELSVTAAMNKIANLSPLVK